MNRTLPSFYLHYDIKSNEPNSIGKNVMATLVSDWRMEKERSWVKPSYLQVLQNMSQMKEAYAITMKAEGYRYYCG